MSITISQIDNTKGVVSTVPEWNEQYKNGFVERQHDTSQLDLVLPDDCLIVAGPPRLSLLNGDNDLYLVGYVNNVSIQEGRQVQPVKAIGSRRHIFAATNAPVQVTMDRMAFYGNNILHALYGKYANNGGFSANRNDKYQAGNGWWDNIEEDIYRIPFGLGIIYKSPRTSRGKNAVSADYLEVCALQSHVVQMQSQQAFVMEQVQIICDRVVPFDGQFTKGSSGTL